MTKLRRRPVNRFHAFIVEPSADFDPTNWQQSPSTYRILKYEGAKYFRGSADAWKFLHNHEALEKGEVKQWAIFLDLNSAWPNSVSSGQRITDKNHVVASLV